MLGPRGGTPDDGPALRPPVGHGEVATDSRRYALIRQSNGKYKKVKVGDKIDGGTVQAITDTEVRYQKGGRLISLKMPKI